MDSIGLNSPAAASQGQQEGQHVGVAAYSDPACLAGSLLLLLLRSLTFSHIS